MRPIWRGMGCDKVTSTRENAIDFDSQSQSDNSKFQEPGVPYRQTPANPRLKVFSLTRAMRHQMRFQTALATVCRSFTIRYCHLKGASLRSASGEKYSIPASALSGGDKLLLEDMIRDAATNHVVPGESHDGSHSFLGSRVRCIGQFVRCAGFITFGTAHLRSSALHSFTNSMSSNVSFLHQSLHFMGVCSLILNVTIVLFLKTMRSRGDKTVLFRRFGSHWYIKGHHTWLKFWRCFRIR